MVSLTGKTKDEVVIALYDCDNDPNRAVNMLLEGDDQVCHRGASRGHGEGGLPRSTLRLRFRANHQSEPAYGQRS